MVSDKVLLSAAIKSRKAWQLLTSNVTPAEIGADTNTLLTIIGEYYNRDSNAQSVDVSLISAALSRTFENPKHVTALAAVLSSLPETSPENVAAEVLHLKRHNLALKLAAALQRSGSSKEELNGSKKLLKEYHELLEATELSTASEDGDIPEKFEVKDLIERAYDPAKLIPIWPPKLTEYLGGGVRPGHHILVFAPTEMGKTLLLINMLVGWVKAKLKVVYVGNEDPVEDLQMRYITRLTELTKPEVLTTPDKAQEILDKRKYERVVFAPLAPGTFETIQRLVDRFGPKVVVLDQLRNLDVASENRTQALEKAATEARNLAKRNQILVVSVAQAGDSASGKRTLQRGDVDSSNVGIPGQMDLMIGIGATEEDENQNIRYLSFPKNKISGGHETFMIRIDPTRSMVLE